MHGAYALRVFILPQVLLFLGIGDRVAGRAMEVDADMDVVFLAEFNRFVDILQNIVVDLLPIAVDDPEAVVHGEADEIEAELMDHLEIFFFEAWLRILPPEHEFLQQIEATPAGELFGGRFWKSRGDGQGHAEDGGQEPVAFH